MWLSIIRKQTGRKTFFTAKIVFFKNLCFQQPLRSLKSALIGSTVNVRIPFVGPLETVPWGLWHSIIREKIGHNIFFTGKIAFLFKNSCFQQPLRSWKNSLIGSTVFVRIACGPLKFVPWCLSYSKIRENLVN